MDDIAFSPDRIGRLTAKIKQTSLPSDLSEKVNLMAQQADSAFKTGQIALLESAEKYIEFVTSLPWNTASADNLDLNNARAIFDKNHHGMQTIKERIVEYLAVLKLKSQQAQTDQVKQRDQLRAPILCFVGLVGTGKTTLAYSIAEAMNRSFIRIPFGGMGSPLDLRGQSRVHPEAEPGLLMKALIRAKSKNPVILLDEIDRVSEAGRADIMEVLVELLDPEQNFAFTDHYLDYPFDLSQVLFAATANNTKNIATAVLDRLEPIQMPSYTDDEKIVIGRDYVFPRELKNCGLTTDQLKIDDGVWHDVVRPLGFDAGIRTLERTINGICRKVAMNIVEGKEQAITLTQENIKDYLPKYQTRI